MTAEVECAHCAKKLRTQSTWPLVLCRSCVAAFTAQKVLNGYHVQNDQRDSYVPFVWYVKVNRLGVGETYDVVNDLEEKCTA